MKKFIILKLIKEICIKNNLTISCCESASGGNLSALLTSIDGSSSFFVGGIISYSNQIKNIILDIPNSTLNKFGAISKEVAKLMAQNIYRMFKTSWSISITGNASKTNLIEDKPSCLYYLGFCSGDETEVFEIKTKVKSRKINQKNIAKIALEILYKKLSERY